MKIFILFILLNTLIFSQSSFEVVSKSNFELISKTFTNEDSSYLPMQIGNLYQFIQTGSGGGHVYSSLQYGSVIKDTIVNLQNYFLYRFSNTDFLYRYSETERKLYELINGNEMLHMDFNKEQGDTFMHLNYPVAATVFEGDTSLFSMPTHYKGFNVPTGSGYMRETFAKGIGLFYSKLATTSYINPSSSSSSLIMAVLFDSLGNTHQFTNHFKPQITVTPITIIDSSNFKLNIMVTHEYDRIYPPTNTSLYFIKSIKFDSYYSKGDSIVNMPLINFSAYITLDTALMKNGFDFNYRIIATDKGIIPETSYSPDSGYYKCVWNGPTRIDENTLIVSDCVLSQNYPNPFNPSTKISWQSPVGSWQTLIVFDVLGREVATLVNEYKNAGSFEVEFNSSNLPSGVYFYQLKIGEFIETKKMLLIK